MDLRVSALHGKYSVTEFHFRNSSGAFPRKVALTKTFFICRLLYVLKFILQIKSATLTESAPAVLPAMPQ